MAHRHVAAHAVLAAGDEVVAVVELVVGVPEDGRVARQRLALVEAHACSQRRMDVWCRDEAIAKVNFGCVAGVQGVYFQGAEK